MARNDIVQYSYRLNLNHPDHLEIHKILHDLNTEIHKSKNQFMVDAMLSYIHGFEKEELTSLAAEEKAKKAGCVSRCELEELEQRIMDKVMKEVITLLCSAIAGRAAYPIPVQEIRQKEKTEKWEEDSAKVDETLEKLALGWS